ncbi:MAG: type II secretion system protein GspG [Candidatus Xenobia bacterium]
MFARPSRLTPILTTVLLLVMLALPCLTATSVAAEPKPATSPDPSASPAHSPAPTATATPTANKEGADLQLCISDMSKLQTLIEFFYLNTGSYPTGLDQLKKEYNDQAPPTSQKIDIPNDPATGKPFVYNLSDDTKNYSLTPPDVSKYGVARLELSKMDWGWMNQMAADNKRKALIQVCAIYIKGISAGLDHYARDNKNQLPDSLEALVPKYVKRMPTCPVCGKPYVYKHDSRGYILACPDPKAHDLEILQFDSTQGLKVR